MANQIIIQTPLSVRSSAADESLFLRVFQRVRAIAHSVMQETHATECGFTMREDGEMALFPLQPTRETTVEYIAPSAEQSCYTRHRQFGDDHHAVLYTREHGSWGIMKLVPKTASPVRFFDLDGAGFTGSVLALREFVLFAAAEFGDDTTDLVLTVDPLSSSGCTAQLSPLARNGKVYFPRPAPFADSYSGSLSPELGQRLADTGSLCRLAEIMSRSIEASLQASSEVACWK